MLYNLNLIAKWFEDTGILSASSIDKQFIKFVEELGETGQELLKNDIDKEALGKEIGDMLVVLTGMAKLTNMPLQHLDGPGLNYQSKLESFANLTVITGTLAEAISKGNDTDFCLIDLGFAIDGLCKVMELDKNECANRAYKKIAKRTGKMVSGVFIKSEDLKETK